MNSVAKLTPGAKQIAGVEAGGRKNGRPGDAFKALLDKVAAPAASRHPHHGVAARDPAAALSDAIRAPTEPASPHGLTGGLHDDTQIGGTEKAEVRKPDDGLEQGLAIPVVIEVPSAMVASKALHVAVDIDPPPPMLADPHASNDQIEDGDPAVLRQARLHPQRSSTADAHSHPPVGQPADAPRLPPASSTSGATPAGPQPESAPSASAPAATALIANRPELATASLPPPAVARYRTYAAPDQPRPPRTDRIERAAEAVQTDPTRETESPGEAPRRGVVRGAPDFLATLRAKSAEPQADSTVAEGSLQQASFDPGASMGLPPATVDAIGTAVTNAASDLASDAAANADPVGPAPDAPGPVRQVEMAVDLQDYGVVILRLALVGEALTLRMSADHADTARRLEHERESLSAILSRSGFDADIRPVDRAAPPAALAASPDGFAQMGGSAPFSDPGSRRAEPGRQRTRSESFTEQSDVDETGRASARRVGALYV